MLGLAVLLVCAIVTATAVLANYQPLWGGGKAWPAPVGVGAKVTREYWLQPGSGLEQLPPNAQYISIPAHKGLMFTYRFSFFNKGATPVTVTSIGLPPSVQRGGGGPIITPEAVLTDQMIANGQGWESMRPFTLPARMGASVQVRVQVLQCVPAQGTVSWNSLPMTFTVHGVHRHDTLPTNVEISLSPQRQNC